MINICQEFEKEHQCRQRRPANGSSVDPIAAGSDREDDQSPPEPSLSACSGFLQFDPAALRLLSASSQTLEKTELIARQALETLPSRAFDKVEDVARLIWKCVPELSLEKAEEIARLALERLPIHRAEEIARHAWEVLPEHPLDKAEEIVRHVWESVPELSLEKAEEVVHNTWNAVHQKARDKAEAIANCARSLMDHHHLPQWLKDNDFLIQGHRPPLNSFKECFISIFSIHTETGNIWTHLLGCVAFIVITIGFLLSSSNELYWQDKVVFTAFFLGAILCLGFSSMFHTVYCHSEEVGRLFSKLDYCGISFLTVGSFIPWLYYNFYCSMGVKLTYFALICGLGGVCIFVSMWDGFAAPRFRTLRAGVFIALGMSGIIPAIHYISVDGLDHAFDFGGFWFLITCASFYLVGAVAYAARVPECLFPGKFDIWFQSHQIFHVCVVIAAFIHYYGILTIASNRLQHGCP